MIKISVVIPIYNTEKFLKKCLDSVVHQTYKNFEIVVVNDCSPDNSEEIILEYQKKYSNIKYIRNDHNQGLYLSRKIGLEHSTGKYILGLDSDDTYTDDKVVESLVSYVDEETDVIAFGVKVVFQDPALEHCNRVDTFPYCELNTPKEKFDAYFCTRHITDTVVCRMFLKEFLIKIYGLAPKKHLIFQEDGLIAMYVLLFSRTFKIVPEVCYNYLQQNNSSTTFSTMDYQRIKKTMEDYYFSITHTIEFLKEHNLWKTYHRFFFERIKSFFYWMYPDMKKKLSPEEYELLSPLFYDAFSPWIYMEDILSNRWYQFGLLSRKHKIKKVVVFILKKMYLYPLVHLGYRLIKRFYLLIE